MMLFGWIPITILSFWLLKPHHAVLFSVLGGWLFLPEAGYDLPGIPGYGKNFAVSGGLILGSVLSGHRRETAYQWKIYDLPILIFCLFPIATSLINQLGLYDGLSVAFEKFLQFGVPYFIGRIYFDTIETLRDLCLAIIIGGVIYLPLCLYEIRMSPQLHTTVYGFFQHSFIQHIRYGGYRPIVFMQHGLMVSLWMALSSIITFWYWRNSDEKHLKGAPLSIIFFFLAGTTILCKSAGALAILIIGIFCCMLYRNLNTIRTFKLLILIVPLYFIFRISGLLSTQDLVSSISFIFDEERVSSFLYRLNQEDLLRVEALKRPFLGWGGFGRGFPIDINTGKTLILTRDSLWLITFQTQGFIGLLSLYTSLLLGPWLILTKSERLNGSSSNYFITFSIALSLLVIFFSIDSLLNSMISPLYIIIAGALISFSLEIGKI